MSRFYITSENFLPTFPPAEKDKFQITLVEGTIKYMMVKPNEEAECYLCLDGGDDDEAGQPLRRDCACRGLSCLAAFAESKSKQARSMDEFRNPWGECPGCHQYYQNGLAVDIATKFVSFALSGGFSSSKAACTQFNV